MPVVNIFDSDASDGIYIRLIDSESYGYYKIPLWVPNSPWAVVIYAIDDVNQTPLYTLFRDGRIDVLDPRFELKYSSFEDSVVIQLYDTTTTQTAWEVLLKVDANYILR